LGTPQRKQVPSYKIDQPEFFHELQVKNFFGNIFIFFSGIPISKKKDQAKPGLFI